MVAPQTLQREAAGNAPGEGAFTSELSLFCTGSRSECHSLPNRLCILFSLRREFPRLFNFMIHSLFLYNLKTVKNYSESKTLLGTILIFVRTW